MPREKMRIAPLEVVSTTAIQDGMIALDQDSKRIALIDDEWGDGQPFDEERVISKGLFATAVIADGMLELGRSLMWLKERLPHGRFEQIVAERYPFDPRTARRFMNAALKFRGKSALQSANIQRSNLLELATLDDDQISELDAGGTVAGLKLDDVQRMSVTELRLALRKEREAHSKDKDIHERQLKRKDDKLNELDKALELATIRAPGWHARTFEIAVETTQKAMAAIDASHGLHTLRDVILNEDFGDDADPAVAAAANVYYDAVSQLYQQVAELAHACHEVFSGYRETARPLAEMEDVFGPIEYPG